MPSSLQGEFTAGGHVSTRPAGFVNPSVGRHQLNTRKAAPLHSLGWGGWLAGWLADRTCHEAEARTTFEAIKTTVAAEKVTPQHGWFEMLVTPTPVVRWALIIGLGTAVLQQVRTPLSSRRRSPQKSDLFLCPTVTVDAPGPALEGYCYAPRQTWTLRTC